MEISQVSNAASRVPAAGTPGSAGAGHPTHAPAADHGELSVRALLLSRLKELPAVRADLVERVRAEIARGDYDSPEKIEAAIERYADEARSTLDLEA